MSSTQPDVEPRPVLLDEAVLEHERLDLVAHLDPLDRLGRRRPSARCGGAGCAGPGSSSTAAAAALGLADVDDPALGVLELVRARGVGDRAGRGALDHAPIVGSRAASRPRLTGRRQHQPLRVEPDVALCSSAHAGLVSGDISAPRPTTPRRGDQAVPTGRTSEPSPAGGHTTCSGSKRRSPSATPTHPPTSSPTRIGAAKADARRPACSSSATTTSATRSCAGPTPGATPSACPCSPQQRPEADYIVFCGVHFMAESADVLTGDHQQVILPDLNAGCSMADMADIDEVEEAWEALGRGHRHRAGRPDHLHELVGRPEGVRRPPRRRGLHLHQRPGRARLGARRPRPHEGAGGRQGAVLPRPAPRPQHRATSSATTEPTCAVWNPRRELGGLTEADCKEATFLLWKGHCSVHQRFRPDARRGLPGRAPRRHRDRPPRVRPRGVRAGRPGRLDRLHHQGRRGRARRVASSASAPRSTSSTGSTTRTPTRPSCRSTRWSARARPCSASTPPHLAWVLEDLVDGQVRQPHHGRRPTPPSGPGSPSQRMLDIT